MNIYDLVWARNIGLIVGGHEDPEVRDLLRILCHKCEGYIMKDLEKSKKNMMIILYIERNQYRKLFRSCGWNF